MRQTRARLSLVVAVVAAGVGAPLAVAAPAAVAAPGLVAAGPTVTLLTGDRVTVGGMNGATVRAAKGREHITFFTEKDEHGDTHVVPEDALPLLSRGKLDPRLFDVTELVRAGYDDASRNTLPLIVDYAGPTPRGVAATISRELPVMDATAVSADRTGAYWPTAQQAEHVWLDGQVRASLDKSVPQIGAPEAWAAGYTGAGTTVAVLDTGIDATHPDLSDAVTEARNFTDSDTTDDRDGHGTHVASTITGNGAKYKGVAPDAKLLNGKVLNDDGYGLESWIIAGMEWAARSGADVVNMSLGSFQPSDGTDPESQAVNRITAETGTLFVVAAGNSGPTPGWIGSPGAADAALTVGAVDRNDQLAGFSSRGPRVGDSAIKPDITAPGVGIVAAKAANSQYGDPDGDGYVALSGTSMATPHVAGAAAIVAGQHPDWTAGQLKAALMATAKPGDYTVFEQGAGRVDVAKAVADTVFSSSGNLSFGFAQWPHDDDQPIAKTLVYTNTGTEPVTLDLAADITGQDGSRAPQGMFTIEPARLTVPAGGQASTTVTADTTVDGPDGVYEGRVNATGGGQSLHTPVAVNREVESYDVTVRALDYNGAPTTDYNYRFVSIAQPDKYHQYVYKPLPGQEVQPVTTLRLPAGEYTYSAVVQQLSGEDYRNAQFVEPAFVLDHDTEIVLDARDTRPADITVDEPTAKVAGAGFGFERRTAWGLSGASASWSPDGSTTLKPSTTTSDAFTFTVEASFAQWNGQSYYGKVYHLRDTDHGIPQTLEWHFLERQLAKVRVHMAATMPGTFGGDGPYVVPLPHTLTEYYTPDVPWGGAFEETLDADGEVAVSASSQREPVTFRLGRTTTVRWGYGVFGPAMGGPSVGGDHADRVGDLLRINVPLVTDPVPGRVGYIAGDGQSQLLRDGRVISEGGPLGSWADVGPERAVYMFRTSADRSSFARLSTKISAEWTFPSEHVEEAALPLLAVQFAPDVDDHNAVPAGRRFTIPVHVRRNDSDEVGGVNTPAVEVSYDDGKTWCPAKVTGRGADWKATVDHPRGAEFVSLRSSVTDQNGFAQHLTIIRAYALK